MSSQKPSFFEELSQRSVIRVGIAYLVVAWLLAQVADLGLDAFEAPAWVMQTFLLLLVLGFPVVLVLAWAFELTPEGIRPEAEVDRSVAATHRKGRRLDFAIIGLLSVALIYFVVEHDWGDGAGVGGAMGPKSIAVLPFDNLSDSQENAFFASGVHEDILTYLAKVADLRVISRTSVRQFSGDARDIKAIAAELGVDNIVEGSVRRAGNTVRVTAQLIDARTDEHLWAENYDRDLANVFEIQTAVAQEIVAALRAELSADERDVISSVPTTNIEAYDKYSQARAIRRDGAYSDVRMVEAEPLLLEAVALDPDFAIAHAMLGSIHTNYYWLDIDRTDERLRRAKAAIDRAFELEPDLPEARAALAEYYYRGFDNYTRALKELEAAHDQFPNNTEVLELMGILQRRLGLWDASIESLQAATQLDPGDFGKKYSLLETMAKAHQWDMASAYGEELATAHPEELKIRAVRATVLLSGYGDVTAASGLFADGAVLIDPDYLYAKLVLAMMADDYDAALALALEYRPLFEYFPAGAHDFLMAWIYHAKGDADRAAEYFARVVEVLGPRIDTTDIKAANWNLLAAESYALLGRRDEALRVARQVLESDALASDRFAAPGIRESASRVLILAGEVDEGLAVLAQVVDQPAGPSQWDLRLNPSWRFMRDDPRFALLAGMDEVTVSAGQ